MSTVAVVSPHLDDAVLSAFLVLADAHRPRVISCFAGVPATAVRGEWDQRTGLASAAAAVAARRAEDKQALGLTGSEAVHLDLLDEQYRGGAEPPHAKLLALLREHLAGAREVWLPAGLGGHTDHLAARNAALAATTPAQRVRVYADLPYAGQPAWPVDVTHAPRDLAVHCLLSALAHPRPVQTWQSTLDSAALGILPIRRHVVRLTRSQFRHKVAAVHRYRTQLGALRCGPRHPLRERRLFAFEVHWTVDGS